MTGTRKPLKSRRRFLMDRRDPGQKMDQEPVEIPIGMMEPEINIADEIQRQIAMQIARRNTPAPGAKETADTIYAELNDLEDDEPDQNPYSQYEYVNMDDHLMDGIDLTDMVENPPLEGEPPAPEGAPPTPEETPPPPV